MVGGVGKKGGRRMRSPISNEPNLYELPMVGESGGTSPSAKDRPAGSTNAPFSSETLAREPQSVSVYGNQKTAQDNSFHQLL